MSGTKLFEAAQRRMVVTHVLRPGTTMSTLWIPVAGRWIFHCHLVAHFLPEMTAGNALVAQPERIHEHGSNHMAGLVLGITVTGKRPAIASHGRTRKLRLLVRERPARNGLPQASAINSRNPTSWVRKMSLRRVRRWYWSGAGR